MNEPASIPNPIRHHRAAHIGLGVKPIATSTGMSDPHISFNASFKSFEMNKFLSDQLPELFEHFKQICPWILDIRPSEWTDRHQWPYVLLGSDRGSLQPVNVPHPTAHDYYEYSGRLGTGSSSRIICIGALTPLPILPLSDICISLSKADSRGHLHVLAASG